VTSGEERQDRSRKNEHHRNNEHSVHDATREDTPADGSPIRKNQPARGNVSRMDTSVAAAVASTDLKESAITARRNIHPTSLNLMQRTESGLATSRFTGEATMKRPHF
jgi:cytochrome oxidase assembly protein ShyY1